tara:strand:- start:200 stop:1393 length:1194 start_codon:yes stop_codon:yes gene_type:complete
MPVQIYNENALPFGFEPEFAGSIDPTSQARQYRTDNVEGFITCSDCGIVNSETNTAILVDCSYAWAAVEEMFNSSVRGGATIPERSSSRGGCGCHVHMSTRRLLNVKTEREREMFCRESIAYTQRTGHMISLEGRTEDPITTEQLRDIIIRMYDQQDIINSLHQKSRTEGHPHFSRFMGHQITSRMARKVRAAQNTSEIVQAMTEANGKFTNINLSNFEQGKQTIEFRQAGGTTETIKIQKWVQLLLNIAQHSIETRHPRPTMTTVTHTTPRTGSSAFAAQARRIRNVYDMMRTDRGATTHEIILATGVAETSVRRMVSEIRNRIGDSALVTHTQQAQNHSYGDGTDYTRYQILETWDEVTARTDVVQDLSNPSIWARTTDDDYDYWFDRIDTIARR